MKQLIIIIFVFFSIIIHAQTTYYVATDGDDSNDGLSITTAWKTISFAASSTSPVVAGDLVYIKAGNYESELVVFQKSGTASQPIVFEGYQNTPGDNPILNYTYGDSVDASLMPLLDGGNRSVGIGINLVDRFYITLKNIQITNYSEGIVTWNSSYTDTHFTLENIFIKDIGFEYATALHISSSSSNIITNCVIVNATGAGMDVSGDNNLIENCQIYSDENYPTVAGEYASSDYYIVIAGDYNTVSNCYIERIGDLEDLGHGIGVKEDGEHNLFENCIAKDLENGGFYVRWEGAQHNEFKNCKAIGTLGDVLGFLVRDGASNNEFNSCISENCTSGIRFLVSGEDADYCGKNNTFNNCIVRNAIWSIEYLSWAIPGPADHNLFANCVFDTADYLFESSRENYDNKMINCIVKDIPNLVTGSETLNFEYTYTDFFNTFSPPSGTGNIFANPLFVDATNADYHLQETSPCIDSGTDVDAPNTDFEGISRPQGVGFDMGAFEYRDTSSVLNQKLENSLWVYPNPVEDWLKINFSKNKIKKLKITSLVGKQLVTKNLLESNQINVSILKKGVYIIAITDQTGKMYVAKFHKL
jgi:hypothetical protein